MDENNSLRIDDAGMASEDMVAIMRQTYKREWWLWSSAISVMILLALGIASFALPGSLAGGNLSAFFSDQTARGLLGLVLLFNVYVIYEQTQIRRIQHKFAERLYEFAVVDPLTGLFNRRYIERRLEGEIARCQRHGTSLTMMLFDLNSFKEVNDQHGHAAGDRVLKTFAERLTKATRGSDVVARHGGDEFLVLLPDCKPDGVQTVLRRLNGIHVTMVGTTVPVCYSAGWADYIIGESTTEFLKRADAALYANKRQIKGVETSGPMLLDTRLSTHSL